MILQWQDPDAVLDIKYIAITTGFGYEGDWVICFPEICDGYHEATEATLVHVWANTDIPDANSKFEGFTGSGYVDFQGLDDQSNFGANDQEESVTWHVHGCN